MAERTPVTVRTRCRVTLGKLATAGRQPSVTCAILRSTYSCLHKTLSRYTKLHMATSRRDPWPRSPNSVFFAGEASASQLSRAVRDGRIRRIARGVYTADLRTDPQRLIQRNVWAVVGHFVPDAIIADRTAATGVPTPGLTPHGDEVSYVFVVSAERTRDVLLPGLIIRPRTGHGQLDDDLPWAAGLTISSHARILVDNLAPSRSRGAAPSRTLTRKELLDWVVQKYQSPPRPETWLIGLRERASVIARHFDAHELIPTIEDMIGAAGRTRRAPAYASNAAVRHLSGEGTDSRRVAMFDQLADYLIKVPSELEIPEYLPETHATSGALPFFEAYFSNFIEGTEFTLAEAERIVQEGEIPALRPEDAHDILSTYRLVASPEGRAVVASDEDGFLDLLRTRHATIMEGRPQMDPGEFKTVDNQAGSYIFVQPDLVSGTLRDGFVRAQRVPAGFLRAVFQLFVVSEVHPFADGNGRVARVFMGSELSATGQSRILIPVVWRNEYIRALRLASRDGRFELLVRTLAHAWKWTAAMPWSDRRAVDGQLLATNALIDSTEAEQRGLRLELP